MDNLKEAYKLLDDCADALTDLKYKEGDAEYDAIEKAYKAVDEARSNIDYEMTK